jgi:small subunit ribosomal protein S6
LRDYELTFIVSPTGEEDRVQETIERVTRLIASVDGEVGEVQPWGRRRLAYPIQRHRDGYYVTMRLRCRPQATTEIERGLRLTEEILRHLLVRAEET